MLPGSRARGGGVRLFVSLSRRPDAPQMACTYGPTHPPGSRAVRFKAFIKPIEGPEGRLREPGCGRVWVITRGAYNVNLCKPDVNKPSTRREVHACS